MSDFWKSYDITAAEYGAGYECYPLFGTVHLIELALSALFLLCMVWWYRRSTPRTRRHILVGVTAALLADEAALLLGMACTGQWNWSYLPLHLCSINVFVCLYNTLTDRSWCKEELYALHDNELCVQDIANAVQLSQSAVSHQLRVLKDSKLVRFRREGKTVYYALDDDHVRSILSLGMDHIEE